MAKKTARCTEMEKKPMVSWVVYAPLPEGTKVFIVDALYYLDTDKVLDFYDEEENVISTFKEWTLVIRKDDGKSS